MSETQAPNLSESSIVEIPIRGTVYRVKTCFLKQETLKFYSDNPRVYSSLHGTDGSTPSQEDIAEHLQDLEHVRELKIDIADNGGLIEPLYVKSSTLEVVEGNSRLAAYRLLASENAVQWDYVKCAVLPKEVTDSAIASLLGQLHLKGKKDWRPYEQASFLYRRHKKDKLTITDLEKEFNLSAKAIKHRIAVIGLMIKHKDNNLEKWSYYDEFLKNRKIQKACEDNPDLEDTVVEQIKSGEVKAVDIRDKLKVVCSTKSMRAVKQFISERNLDDAYKTAKSLGGDNSALQKLKKFRLWVVESSTKYAVKSAPDRIKPQIRHELNGIKTQITKLLDTVTRIQPR